MHSVSSHHSYFTVSVVCNSPTASRTLTTFCKWALRIRFYTERLVSKLAAWSHLHKGLRNSGLAWVGNYRLHLEKTLVTQLGGNATYASGTGRDLGPWPAPKRRQRSGSQRDVSVGSRVPLRKEGTNGSISCLFHPVAPLPASASRSWSVQGLP